MKMGDVKVFLNVPMPRVFGAPSCVRNAIERHGDPTKLVKTAFVTKKITLDKALLVDMDTWPTKRAMTSKFSRHQELTCVLHCLVWTPDTFGA
jgi:hypothetical protein